MNDENSPCKECDPYVGGPYQSRKLHDLFFSSEESRINHVKNLKSGLSPMIFKNFLNELNPDDYRLIYVSSDGVSKEQIRQELHKQCANKKL